MNRSGYHSPVRSARRAATRQGILDAVGALLDRGQEPTFALVARRAKCEQRTVYRHFPTKQALAAAFWKHQVAEHDGELAPSVRRASPSTEAELLAAIGPVFAAFDRRERRIRAMLHTQHGRAARLSDNHRRQQSFLAVVEAAVPGLPPATRRRAAAALQLVFSAAAWESFADYWSLSGPAASAAARQAIIALLDGLRVEASRQKRRT